MTTTALPLPRSSTQGIMLTVLIALLPATAVHIWFAGSAWALGLLAACLLAIMLEALALRLRGRDAGVRHQDGSVLVTAVLLLLLLPISLPWWQSAVAILIAVVVGKHIFGGLGQNLYNPVALGYLALMSPHMGLSLPGATLLQADGQTWVTATMVLAALSGGMLLLLQRIIGWQVPLAILLTSIILFYGFDLTINYSVLVLVAFFVATDPVTCPGTRAGKLIYGSVVAVLSAILTLWLPYTTAMAAAMLCGNAITPSLDHIIRYDWIVAQPGKKS
jgi:electron transport complex protein RnfD